MPWENWEGKSATRDIYENFTSNVSINTYKKLVNQKNMQWTPLLGIPYARNQEYKEGSSYSVFEEINKLGDKNNN